MIYLCFNDVLWFFLGGGVGVLACSLKNLTSTW